MDNAAVNSFLNIALDLSRNLPHRTRYQRLVEALQSVFPCDACVIFMFDENRHLRPVAMAGLVREVLGKRFLPSQHPRLDVILKSKNVVRFPANSTLPDPFDGLLADDPDKAIDVHACMGCSLYVDDALIGAVTLDAKQRNVFDTIDDVTVETYAALVAASVRNIALFEALEKANDRQQKVNQLLIEEARYKGGEIVGTSPVMLQLKRDISVVAPSDYTVLIQGETGTGKELVAHELHRLSGRAGKPMVYVNCAALPEPLAESELFGHRKGAFTGANENRAGKFELADGGTLFLDEVGELPLAIQAKLLRVIQHGEVQRVGSDRNARVDVRVIAATNRNLSQSVKEGRFRADLYHRLNVYPILVPPLVKREGDIPLLTGYFLERIRHQLKLEKLRIHPVALDLLAVQAWPGNVRELEHTLMRAALQATQEDTTVIHNHHLHPDLRSSQPEEEEQIMPSGPISMREAVEDFQRRLINHALLQNNGVWSRAATFLKMDRGNLHKLGVKLGLK